MSDDLIKRSDAIEQIQVWAVNLSNPKMLSREDAVLTLKNLPSAARPKGEWIERLVLYKDEANGVIEDWQSARCSVCGKYHTTPYLYSFDNYNFCPSCGADMRGADDE